VSATARQIVLEFHGMQQSFDCDELIDGVPINPELPDDFGDTANEDRPVRHLAWWGVPFIEICTCDHPKFIEAWQGSIRFDVRCLDGGAWDRPTCLGMFGSLSEALACIKKRPPSVGKAIYRQAGR
jgi:hypothetical protein